MKLAVIAAAMLLLYVLPGYSQEQKLVGHWRFDEGEGNIVRDASGEGNDGSIIKFDERVFRTQGRRTGALEFRNEDAGTREHGYVRIPDTGQYDFTTGMTVVIWFQPVMRQRSYRYDLVTNFISGGRGPGFCLFAWSGRIILRSGDGTASWEAGSQSEEFPIRSGDWHHVTAAYNGSLLRIYINGELAAERELDGRGLTEGRNSINIGAYADGYAYGFNGVIDEVKLYNYALSHADIMEDFNR